MADRSLINLWLLEAADAHPDDTDKQIAWLRIERKKYAPAVKTGDWEISSTSQEGASAQQKRGVSDRQNHDAIVRALQRLGADLGGVSERPGIILPVFEGITN